jgi:hypothetical protein
MGAYWALLSELQRYERTGSADASDAVEHAPAEESTPSQSGISSSDPMRPTKRARSPTDPAEGLNFTSESSATLRSVLSTRPRGLGRHLSRLPDDIVLNILEGLDGFDLVRFAQCSKAAYVYAHHADLWRALVLVEFGSGMRFDTQSGNWRQTWVQSRKPKGWDECPVHRPLRVRGVFSDLLFKPWVCSHLEVPSQWLEASSIPRVDVSSLTVEEFEERFERPNVPVILTGWSTKWKAMESWTPHALTERFGSRKIHAGGFEFSMKEYLEYAAAVQDDQPLYMFDRDFFTHCPEAEDDYCPPPFFEDERDCFACLGADRPARRWLIVGPHRSGSSFHKDPNATCAWNAVITGKKRWIMYPPDQTPPGVHASRDGSEVMSPMALLEWVLDFYGIAMAQRKAKRAKPTEAVYPLEGTCHPGEIMFVPRGWWHTAINIGTTVALTQNYAPHCGAWAVWRFLKDKPDQVSGVPSANRSSLAAKFASALEQHAPGVWAKVLADEERFQDAHKARAKMVVSRKWASTKQSVEASSSSSGGNSATSFRFGFSNSVCDTPFGAGAAVQ